MLKSLRRPVIALAAIAALAVPAAVQAHRVWMIASSTVLSGDEAWVTIDAAVGNELFYFDHVALRGDFAVTAPDGSAVEVQNEHTGRLRTTFDAHLEQQGTYRVAMVREGAMGSYMLNGERQRLPRGLKAAEVADALPEGATDVQVIENNIRTELYVTLGQPSETVFTPTGKGIELVPVTHPNDLYAGEEATFLFLLNGEPAANIDVLVVPGGSRYRDNQGQMDLTTDAEGKVRITWPEAGRYWIELDHGGRGGAPSEDGGPRSRAAYTATFEVLPL
ncbi:DUF4198 domain-containing protein [Stakelama tenebrarum]|uniref:DUF4198 domain-containing protein n=1 Tax=Stakelama tenebrarum TaxID=2711215 RepID=A0A6G6Y3L4_9SPHN|nr:DUF4198 domain-containing protein [Sphingosinithalassobacter tenebrarum]QIG79203.1 DUF4198 domain-containing protein [Sphingosinithalassobacter tenebrarum]